MGLSHDIKGECGMNTIRIVAEDEDREEDGDG